MLSIHISIFFHIVRNARLAAISRVHSVFCPRYDVACVYVCTLADKLQIFNKTFGQKDGLQSAFFTTQSSFPQIVDCSAKNECWFLHITGHE